jgi:hypothetical protein
MAKRRTIKREITNACASIFSECLAVSLYGPNKDRAQALLYSIIKLEIDYVSRVSHVEPGMPAKKYFKDLVEKFTAEATDILDQLRNN